MSNINKQALREAAEKATPGNWRRASTRFNGITAQGVYPPCGKEEILASTAEKRDAEFIAAANPSTVLALLDELEAAEKRVAELEAREVVLPQRISMEGGAYCTAHARYDEDGDYYYRDEVIESLVAAGIITKVGE
ncbi:ead/Ea22-like family protein [Escherichia coli]|nr:ead/Ea22-like family protein [Escherichia coli]